MPGEKNISLEQLDEFEFNKEKKQDIRKLKAGKKDQLYFLLRQRYPTQKLDNGMTIHQYVKSLEDEIAAEDTKE